MPQSDAWNCLCRVEKGFNCPLGFGVPLWEWLITALGIEIANQSQAVTLPPQSNSVNPTTTVLTDHIAQARDDMGPTLS